MAKLPLPFRCRSPALWRYPGMHRVVPLLLAAAACSSAPSAPAAFEPAPSALLGQWRIVALDSRTPVAGRDDKAPALTFDEHGYGG